MATLAFAAAGAAIGSALLPTGLTLFGATLSGAMIGAQVGAFAGSYVDQALFGAGQGRSVEGPRLKDLHVTASTEGAPIPRLYGRARLGAQVIWATEFEEEVVTKSAGGGGKGLGGSSGGSEVTEYRYYANFAVALAEGEIVGIGRVWADGQELDISQLTYRVYTGSETQFPDPLIEAREGAGNAPAFRGTAYVVFERLALAPFGNRVPQLSFEVSRAVDDFADEVRGVVVIPGAGEFVYGTEPVVQEFGGGESRSENVHTRQGGTDWTVSLDQLEATLPNANSVSLVVSWFGTDLRAANCQIRPGVEVAAENDEPAHVAGRRRHALRCARGESERRAACLWRHAVGRDRRGGHSGPQGARAFGHAHAVRADGRAGGQYAAQSVRRQRVAAGLPLARAHHGRSGAGATWDGRQDRGGGGAGRRIRGYGGPGAFQSVGRERGLFRAAEWSYRRMVLHQAWLAKAAGGVDAFVIGTELKGLTQVRSAAAAYPFVAALVQLAADVKTILGSGTKVTYAADWSEYFGHQPQDGSGDVYFHLDPLWASANVDAIGIDLYWPLADWRAGRGHLDYLAGARSVYDLAYLRGNVQGGEGYDWYYASAAARDAQARTPITDGGGKPWVFRYKDLKSWWLNAHYDRPGGVESGTPTAWVPQSKPFWFLEIGCPAVHLGANQPNVFVDPKSAESALPYYSNGTRDDLVQRRFLQALIEAFDPAHPNYVAEINPASAIYGGRMVDLARVHVYAWDARPYPAFPSNLDEWGDGENWRLGHWLNGRLAGGPLAATVARVLQDYGFAEYDAGALEGSVPGYVIDRVMSAREALQPLELGYFVDALETGGRIVFRQRGSQPPSVAIDEDGLVETRPSEALLTLTRGQETELPASAKVSFISGSGDYRQAVAEARRLAGASGRVAQAGLAIVLEAEDAEAMAETWLFETWASRERASFTLPPSRLALEPGDVIALEHDGSSHLVRITEVGEHGMRAIEARTVDPEVYGRMAGRVRPSPAPPPVLAGTPAIEFLDLPLLRGDEPPHAGYAATRQVPWPGAIAIYGSPEPAGYTLRALATAPATMGQTLDPLPAGPTSRFDRATRLRVLLSGGALQSATPLQVLAGSNAAAVRTANGEWEVLQFETAVLVAPLTYEISGLLRGQAGTEVVMNASVAVGAPFVLLDGAVVRIELTQDEIGLPYSWRYGPAGRSVGDATFGERTHAFRGLGLKPLSPAHVRGARNASGDLSLSWIRRTRSGGDGWEAAEVPLGEAEERYEIDIVDGALVKRTLAVTTPAATYMAAQQIADFGAPQAAVSARVYQMSAVAGRGSPAIAVL